MMFWSLSSVLKHDRLFVESYPRSHHAHSHPHPLPLWKCNLESDLEFWAQCSVSSLVVSIAQDSTPECWGKQEQVQGQMQTEDHLLPKVQDKASLGFPVDFGVSPCPFTLSLCALTCIQNHQITVGLFIHTNYKLSCNSNKQIDINIYEIWWNDLKYLIPISLFLCWVFMLSLCEKCFKWLWS